MPPPFRRTLTYDEFRKLARNSALSLHEKVGFPNAYREGKEHLIFGDILRKLPNLSRNNQTVVDVGPGCSGLAVMLLDYSKARGHRVVLADSREMLDQLPDSELVEKVAGRFPDECEDMITHYSGRSDVVLTYSVFHYVFEEGDVYAFLDSLTALLAPGGQLLIGDIPNASRRRRFFTSEAGIRYHQEFTGTDTLPPTIDTTAHAIDDELLVNMVRHARAAGFDAYVVPQSPDLPMANRREDIVVTRP